MKKLLLLFLLLPSLCFGTITRVQSKTATTGGTNGALNLVLDAAPTNGNLLILAAIGSVAAGGPLIASTADITWIPAAKFATTSEIIIFIGYVRTGSASATIALTQPTTQPIAAVCAEYSGFTSARFDRSAFASGSSTSPSSGATSTTRTAAELWIGAIGQRGQNTATFSAPGGSFAIVGQTGTTNNTANNDRSVCLLEQIAAGTGTPTASATSDQNNGWSAYCLTFDEAATGGAVQTARIYGQ